MAGVGRDPPGQQQRQRRRAVGGIARGEIVSGDAAVGVHAAIDVHQLRGALGLPRMFLLARELHAHGTADRARQQQRVGGDVVGAVAAVAAGGLQPDHLDLGFRLLDQQREVGAQDVRVLRAGPHADIAVADNPRPRRTGRSRRASGRARHKCAASALPPPQSRHRHRPCRSASAASTDWRAAPSRYRRDRAGQASSSSSP